ncbi:MAG: hypothetical protein IKD63_00965 [Oscillospiraceae bacterium]|nr:hypothetical protein [Oscillospiraceae bacterium]
MAKVTSKENFLMLAHGGHPEYVPVYTMMGVPYMGEVADVMMMAPVFKSSAFVDGGTDEWGVRYVAAEGTNRATMPDTSIVMLEDIEDWTKVIKFPEPNEVDFEKTYEQQLKQFNIDRNRSAVKCGPGFQPFQELVAIMGFAGGLMALASDPEEVKAMLNAMVDHIEPYFEKTLDYYKPDLWMMGDDTCTKLAPFFSPETYKDVFLPIYHRMADPAVERGIPVEFHICGYCEPFMDFMVDFGVQMMDPVQASNDIVKCKEKYKGKLSFMGGWEWALHMPKDYPEFDEEELRQTVRDTMDKYAPGGAYAFYHSGLVSYFGDPVVEECKRIVRDEAHWYGRKIYGYTGE